MTRKLPTGMHVRSGFFLVCGLVSVSDELPVVGFRTGTRWPPTHPAMCLAH